MDNESFYVRATTWLDSTSTPTSVVSGRIRLHSVVVHNKSVTVQNDVKSLVLTDTSSGETLLECSFTCDSAAAGGRELQTFQFDMGGNGILFSGGITLNFGSSTSPGGQESLSSVTLFHS